MGGGRRAKTSPGFTVYVAQGSQRLGRETLAHPVCAFCFFFPTAANLCTEKNSLNQHRTHIKVRSSLNFPFLKGAEGKDLKGKESKKHSISPFMLAEVNFKFSSARFSCRFYHLRRSVQESCSSSNLLTVTTPIISHIGNQNIIRR